MKGKWECIEQAVEDSQQGVVLQVGGGRGLTVHYKEKEYVTKCYT
jgi:hypothetical protein